MSGSTALITAFGMFFLLSLSQLVIGRWCRVPRPAKIYNFGRELIFRLITVFALTVAVGLQVEVVTAWLYWTGLGIMVASWGLLCWSQLTLGKNWIPRVGLHGNHTLVTSGPYAYIRHPLYTAISLYWLGCGVACTNVAMFSAGCFWILSVMIRVPHEEALMEKKFKKRWQNYAAKTPAFLPRLSR